ncbi:amino acid adenylation [Calothrix brevissima NIES-22]|nr:amino acid adenylation [Calothrix brevissima NIES-22]
MNKPLRHEERQEKQINEMIAGFEISPQQKHLWLLQEDSLPYCSQLAITIIGELKLDTLKVALAKLVDKHEILRTNFICVHESSLPIQIISDRSNFQWQEIDLKNLEDEQQQARIAELFQAEGQYSFNLQQGSVVRFTLINLSPQKYTLLITLPALCADSITLNNIVQEISDLYRNGGKNEASELPLQYVQVAAWQNEILAQENTQTVTGYWQQNKIIDLLNLQLPFELKPVNQQNFQPQFISLNICPDIVEKIKLFIQEHHNISTFLFFITCWQILLWRLTGQPDIVIGTICDGRNYQELESTLGLLAKYLPIHYHLEDDDTFFNVLQKVEQSVGEAYAYQEYFTWSQIVGESEHIPLFCFDFQQQNIKYIADDLTLTIDKQYVCFDRFKVKLCCIEKENAIALEFHYDSQLFTADTIERLAGNFNTLLESLVHNFDTSINKLQIVSAAERQKLLVEWNHTQVDYPQDKCIHQLFEAQVELTPNAVAVVFADQQLTYNQLNIKANQLAHQLQQLGVKPDVLVGICMERSVEMVIGLLAILKAGGAYVPVDPAYPQERIAFMLAETSVSVLLTQSQLREILPPHPATVICVDNDWDAISTHPQSNLTSGVTINHLAYVIYTSGSTGKPKGVMNTHQGLCNRLLWMQSTYQLTTTDRVLQKTPFSFDVSVWEFFWTLITGACLVVAKPKGHQDSAYLVKLIAQEKITTIHFVPSMLQFFIAEPALELCQSLKRVFCSGEALPFELQQRFFERLNVELHNLYGPTEAAIDVTFWQCQRQSNLTIVPIGRPIQNTQIYILDSYQQPVPIGVPGELHIGGDGLARGYLNSPELTAQKFIPNPFDNSKLYKTGDLARYLRDGNIEYLGRIDHQVKIRGFRIELGEIEAVLSQHPAVRETVVLARTDSPGNQQLVAYIVTVSEPTPTVSELRRFLQEKLPDYMLPGAFVFLNTLPLTVNGKINRQVLPPPAKLRCLTTSRYASTQLEVADVTPQTEVEAKIATVWQKVLNLANIGIYDNFFELGGNSLLIFQVNNQLRQIFAIDLSIPELFKYPTIQSLGAYLQQFNSQDDSCEQLQIKPLSQESNYFLLSFAQQRLWFLDQLQPGNTVYNISQAIHLKGSLNITALEQSFREIINRHAALRTTFTTVDGRPVQIISSVADFTMPVVDLTDLAANQQQLQVQKLATQEAQHSFDLVKGPLLRVKLLKLSEAEHILLFVIHHIVADAKSCAIIIREIAILYEAFSQGEPSPLPELSLQYSDFAHWQRQWLQGKVLETQLAYWKQQLAGLPPVLNLPTDKSIPKVTSLAGANISFMLTPNLSQMLKKFSLEAGVTLFMTLLAAFQTLLYRYSHQEDFAVGTAIANRKSSETESLIGFFVNTLVLRANLAGNPSFVELLNRVREVALAAYAHQDLPFEKLVEELQPERHLSHNPLFQVMFVLWNAPMPDLQLEDLSLVPLDVESTVSRVDLTLAVADKPEGLQASFEYKTDLFDAATINRMVEHFQRLLESIVANPHQQLTDVTFDIQVDRQLLLEPDTTRPRLDQAFVAPRTTIEKILADIWVSLLGVEQVGIYDNFFELGGHSLLLTQLLNRLHSTFKIDIALSHLFENQTIATLSQFIIDKTSNQEAEVKPKLNRDLLLKAFPTERLSLVEDYLKQRITQIPHNGSLSELDLQQVAAALLEDLQISVSSEDLLKMSAIAQLAQFIVTEITSNSDSEQQLIAKFTQLSDADRKLLLSNMLSADEVEL